MIISELTRKELASGGVCIEFVHRSETEKPGTIRNISVYLPKALQLPAEAAIHFSLDGLRDGLPPIVEKLIPEGAVPPAVCVGVQAARYPASLPDGFERSVRSPEYDGLGPSLANYLIRELIPVIKTLLPEGLTISDNPDLHGISGCSSGGIAAWNACWERNDFFHRCSMYSPSFSSFRGGDSLPVLMRKFETKPIRCHMTVGTDDMKNSAGNWYLEALTAKEALEYAGYDYGFELFEGGAHGEGSCDPAVMERVVRFVWMDWKTRPVSFRFYPPRIADILSPDTKWEETTVPMPQPPACPYTCSGNSILLQDKIVAEMPGPVSQVTLSSDRWRLYAAVSGKRFVYALAIQPDGSLKDCYAHAHLHLKDDFVQPGAFSICIDSGDRLYAATELGIQTICHNGETNTILPLPGNPAVTEIAFGLSEKDTSMLYARTDTGKVYRREVRTYAPSGKIQPPDTISF